MGVGSYCWARMRGTGLSDCRDRARSPVRLLNMGSVDRGGGTPRLPAMFLSSSVFPRMVWWWYSWILQRGDEPGSRVYTQKCLDRLLKGARCRIWRFKLRVSRVYSHQSTYWFVLAFLFSLQKEKKEEQCVTSGSIITFRLKGQKEMCVFNKQHCGSLLSFTYTPSRLQNMT